MPWTGLSVPSADHAAIVLLRLPSPPSLHSERSSTTSQDRTVTIGFGSQLRKASDSSSTINGIALVIKAFQGQTYVYLRKSKSQQKYAPHFVNRKDASTYPLQIKRRPMVNRDSSSLNVRRRIQEFRTPRRGLGGHSRDLKIGLNHAALYQAHAMLC